MGRHVSHDRLTLITVGAGTLADPLQELADGAPLQVIGA